MSRLAFTLTVQHRHWSAGQLVPLPARRADRSQSGCISTIGWVAANAASESKRAYQIGTFAGVRYRR